MGSRAWRKIATCAYAYARQCTHAGVAGEGLGGGVAVGVLHEEVKVSELLVLADGIEGHLHKALMSALKTPIKPYLLLVLHTDPQDRESGGHAPKTQWFTSCHEPKLHAGPGGQAKD